MAIDVLDGQDGFGTLNTTSDPYHLGPREIQTAINAKPTLFGGVTPRSGSQRVLSGTGGIPGPSGALSGCFIWANGNPDLLISYGNSLWVANISLPPPWTPINVGSGPGGPGQVSYAAFVDATGAQCVYMADGNGFLWKWNGATVSQVTTTQTGLDFIKVQNQRLFGIVNNRFGGLAGPAAGQALFWSSLNNGDDCGTATTGHPEAGGEAIINTFGESYLTDLCAFGPGLVIGHFGGMSQFTGWGQNDISIQSGTAGVSAETGVARPQSMAAVENYMVLASDRGVYVLSAWGVLQTISKPIQATWPKIIGQLDQFDNRAVIVLHDKIAHSIYFVTNPDQGGVNTPSTIYGYNYQTEGWFGPWTYSWGGAAPSNLCAGYDGFGNYYVLATCSDGIIRRLEVGGLGLDDVNADGSGGAPYQMQVTSRPFFGRDQSGRALIDHLKAWQWVDVQAQVINPQSANVAIYSWPVEGAQPPLLVQAISYNNQPDVTPRSYRMQTGNRGQALQLVIQDTPVNNAGGQNVYFGAIALAHDLGRVAQ